MKKEVREILNRGTVIPAMPLALDSRRKLDEKHQRAIIRYYLDAGAGGIAVGVHTTQFAIRNPEFNLLEPLFEIASQEFDRYRERSGKHPVRIAGVIGKTKQAVAEARLAADSGYDAALLSLAAFRGASDRTMLEHCSTIGDIIPVIGFYLQPAVGGRQLSMNFWREFSSIKNVAAIKIAPFNRYQTLDVVRGVAESGRSDEIALYTGNDDNILIDLLTEFEIPVNGRMIRKRIAGGLLGHWAVWTRTAVKMLEDVRQGKFDKNSAYALTLASKITDCNSAFFDAAHNFKGCIAGLHEVLRRQGLMKGIWTLDRKEKLSPGQKEEIDRVYASYPELNDDDFVRKNIGKWLSD
ncbi:MAG TPA: dihydrodipicolinate synthase family protein [Bacteroidales bacterium]|jgi:hypothetical protein|nr:dihydrodipicolinate synthase family protein [Bacteroidales bacterium]